MYDGVSLSNATEQAPHPVKATVRTTARIATDLLVMHVVQAYKVYLLHGTGKDGAFADTPVGDIASSNTPGSTA